MERSSRISVITAAFNAADTIADTLASIRAQREVDVEHIVIDGGSTDGTADLLRSSVDGIDVLVSEPDRGVYDALNKGLARATGDIVGFLHADDVYAADDVLSRIAGAFRDPAVNVVYGDLQYVRRDDPARVVRHWRAGGFRPGALHRGWMPPHPTLHVRRAHCERIGPFDLSYRIAADYDHMLRLFLDPETRPLYLPEVLVRMRTGGMSNRSVANVILKSREDMRAIRAHRVGGLATLLGKNAGKLAQFLPVKATRDPAPVR
jgi:glycosyltransferase involved in cell wall biosynthesis